MFADIVCFLGTSNTRFASGWRDLQTIFQDKCCHCGSDPMVPGSFEPYVVDALLTDNNITEIITDMETGKDTLVGCDECAVNTFKASVGNEMCTICPENSFLSIIGSIILTDCKCGPGYTGSDGSVCSACPPGSLKNTFGDSACIPYTYPVDQFSSEVAANVAAVCWPCPSNALSIAASKSLTACQCRAGTYEETRVLNPPYAQRSYSSIYSNAHFGSLLHDLNARMAWVPSVTNTNQWMQIDAGMPMYIRGVITQGRGSMLPSQFATQFKVQYRLTAAVETGVTIAEDFIMASATKEHIFTSPIYARYIRFMVLTWNKQIAMRAALIVQSCSLCIGTLTSLRGSMSEADCVCPGRTYKFSSAADQRAIALVPGQAHLSTLVNRGLRNYSATAQFDGSAGPPSAKGTVTFDRDTSQYLDGGLHTFNIDTNGFTVVIVVRFTSVGSWERILDMGNTTNSDNIMITRIGTGNALQFSIRNGVSDCSLRSANDPAVLNTWLTIVATYDHNDMNLKMRIGNTIITPVSCDTARINMNVDNTFVGKSYADDAYFSGSIAGLYAVDALLTESEIAEVASRMNAGNDALQTCAPCPAKIFESGPGVAFSVCQTCPQTSLLLEDICMPCPLGTVPVPDQKRCVSLQQNSSINIVNATDVYRDILRSSNNVATPLLISKTFLRVNATLVINAATHEETLWQHITKQTTRSCQYLFSIIAAIPSIEDQYLQAVRLLKNIGPCAPGLTGYDLLQDPGNTEFMDSEYVLLATTAEDTRRDALLVVQRQYMGRDAKDQYKIYNYSAQYLTPALVRHVFASGLLDSAQVSFCNVRDREHSSAAFETAMSRVGLWTVPQNFSVVDMDEMTQNRQSVLCA